MILYGCDLSCWKLTSKMRWNCIRKECRFLQILPNFYYLDSTFFAIFITPKTFDNALLEFKFKLSQHWGNYAGWEFSKKTFWNERTNITLFITNVHLFLHVIQLWWSIFGGIVNGDIVNSQTWVVLPQKIQSSHLKALIESEMSTLFIHCTVKCIRIVTALGALKLDSLEGSIKQPGTVIWEFAQGGITDHVLKWFNNCTLYYFWVWIIWNIK